MNSRRSLTAMKDTGSVIIGAFEDVPGDMLKERFCLSKVLCKFQRKSAIPTQYRNVFSVCSLLDNLHSRPPCATEQLARSFLSRNQRLIRHRLRNATNKDLCAFTRRLVL